MRVIVCGLGGMGSAAAYHAQKRGCQVIGIDPNPPLHQLGSSHGNSRIIRQAYYEAPDYVPLLLRSYQLWHELEEASGQKLLDITGGIFIGPPGGELVSGSRLSCQTYSLPYEMLDAPEIARRSPFRPDHDWQAVYEHKAGILNPESCIKAHLDCAARLGAQFCFGETVTEFSTTLSGVQVRTNLATHQADRLIVTAGPWAPQVLAALGLPLAVRRVVVAHFVPNQTELFRKDRLPIFCMQCPQGFFYGFPFLDEIGLKAGRHDKDDPCTAQTVDRHVKPAEIAEIKNVLDRYLPGAAEHIRSTSTCLYTMTPDKHFIIDVMPESESIIFACGFSGHGFKFAAVIGEILTDLALAGSTAAPIKFLSAHRFLPHNAAQGGLLK